MEEQSSTNSGKQRFIDFITGVFSSGTPESSKRFFGSIGFLCSIVIIYIWRRDLTESLLITSAGLLGLETLTNIFNKR